MPERPFPSHPVEQPEGGGGPCARCYGTGYQVQVDADGVERARACGCRDGRREGVLVEEARIPRRYEHCSFENYENHHPAQETARQFARRFVKENPDIRERLAEQVYAAKGLKRLARTDVDSNKAADAGTKETPAVPAAAK